MYCIKIERAVAKGNGFTLGMMQEKATFHLPYTTSLKKQRGFWIRRLLKHILLGSQALKKGFASPNKQGRNPSKISGQHLTAHPYPGDFIFFFCFN